MNIAYLDPIGGISGDMFLAALLDTEEGNDCEEKLLEQLHDLQPDHWHWDRKKVTRRGFSGTKIDFHAEEEKTHRHFSDIISMITKAGFPKKAEEKILKTFHLLAEAEAKVHGVPKEQVHFHEVGAIDTILDICSVCLILTELQIDKIVCAPLPMGKGTVHCAHGEIPLPAPAVAELLKGAAVKESSVFGETVTPTGIALLKSFDVSFGNLPSMTVNDIGCGCGTRDSDVPNILRIFLGSTIENKKDSLYRLECTIDDMSGEEMGYLWEHIINAGANDMYYTSVYMKKGRPAIKLTVLTEKQNLEKTEQAIFTHTTTLGMIRQEVERSVLDRHFETIETPLGKVTYKIAEGHGITKWKAEYEDLKAISDKNDIPLKEARTMADQIFSKQNKEQHHD